MGKARMNNGNYYFKLDAMCLDCSTKIKVQRKGFKGHLYQIEGEMCPICLKETKHVICKNLDELKAELQFSRNLIEEEEMILEIINNEKNKVR